jgi:hypothetical protein
MEKASMLELKGFSYLAFLAADDPSDSSKVCDVPTFTGAKSSLRLKAMAEGCEGPVYGFPLFLVPIFPAGLFHFI